ncbi:MAG TPA: hypothetical protein VH268_07485 [Solirubrobacterales bacterium]|nr:hypothetical protein [Solirubrobacterales bacterium]
MGSLQAARERGAQLGEVAAAGDAIEAVASSTTANVGSCSAPAMAGCAPSHSTRRCRWRSCRAATPPPPCFDALAAWEGLRPLALS